MGPNVRRPHTHLLLEGLGFLRQEGVCFANDRDDIDLLVHRPEERHIQGPEPAPRDWPGLGLGVQRHPPTHTLPKCPNPQGVLPDPRPKGEMK